MAGLYIHIPYCRKACTYCNFHFSTGQNGRDEMISSIIREYEFTAPLFEGPWKTVYFGGGTPSILPPAEIGRLLEKIRAERGIISGAEITLEANPEDISPENLDAWLQIGINRLSIGVQSLSDEELAVMNRAHRSAQSLAAVQLAIRHGFGSVNVDLIFGSPWLNDTSWEKTLNWALNCGADHISAYALTIEEKTRLKKQISRGEVPMPAEDRQAAQYLRLCDKATAAGWDFYELSNLAIPGRRAVHNSAYWNNEPYLGLGPSAHSFDGQRMRWWNIADNMAYIRAIAEEQPAREQENLSDADLFNEFLMTRLRMTEGADLGRLRSMMPDWEQQHRQELDQFMEQELVLIKDESLVLTRKGRLLADHITATLMVE